MTMTTHLRIGEVPQQAQNACQIAIRMMMEDAHNLSTPITPYKEGGLRTSVTKQMPTPLLGIMTWNVPYAQYQEKGMRADGTHIVRNYTTPGTHAHFVEESLNKVAQRIPQYIRMGGLI